MTTTIKRPSLRTKFVRCYQGKKERTFLGLFNLDFWRGKRHGKKAPSACQSAVDTISAEELRDRDDFRGRLRQVIGEAQTNLGHIDRQTEQNEEQKRILEANGRLLPESSVASSYGAALRDLFLGALLMGAEVYSLSYAIRTALGMSPISALVFASIFSAMLAIGVKLTISHLPEHKRPRVILVSSVAGMFMAFVSLIGITVLRYANIQGDVTGGPLDGGLISVGGALCALGFIGLPVTIGALFADAHDKLSAAKDSGEVYGTRKLLQTRSNEWNVEHNTLQELDSRLDAVVEQTIAARIGKYTQGAHIGAAGNQEAVELIRRLNR